MYCGLGIALKAGKELCAIAIHARAGNMTDRIDEIVEKAIEYTDEITLRNTTHWLTARQGLLKMLENLQTGAPDHPGYERLKTFIAEQNLIYGDDDLRH